MNPEQALEEMQAAGRQGPEDGHEEADDILCRAIRHLADALGEGERWERVLRVYDGLTRWYS